MKKKRLLIENQNKRNYSDQKKSVNANNVRILSRTTLEILENQEKI